MAVKYGFGLIKFASIFPNLLRVNLIHRKLRLATGKFILAKILKLTTIERW